MRAIIAAALLAVSTTAALGEPVTVDQRVGALIGQLAIENATLHTQLDVLQQRLEAELKRKAAVPDKAPAEPAAPAK